MSPVPRLTADLAERRRTLSTARRLLAGVGSAAYVAYRDDPETEVPLLAHGVCADGRLVVVGVAPASEGLTSEQPVRVDLRREAAQARTRILVASLHLLATVRWESPATVAAEGLPRSVGHALRAPGARLGVLTADRVLLHDGGGVHAHPLEDVLTGGVAPAFVGSDDLLAVTDEVSAMSQVDLHELCEAATRGATGTVLSSRATDGCASALRGSVCLLDVDAVGATLLRTSDAQVQVVHVPFVRPVADAAQVAVELASLVPRRSTLLSPVD